MGISILQWRDWKARGTESGQDLLLFRCVSLHRPLSFLAEMTGGLCREKPKLYFKTFCQERPLEQIQPLDRMPEGQTTAVWSAGFGGTFKKEEEEGKHHTFPEGSFLVLLRDGKDVRKFCQEEMKGSWKPASLATVEIVLKSSHGFWTEPYNWL